MFYLCLGAGGYLLLKGAIVNSREHVREGFYIIAVGILFPVVFPVLLVTELLSYTDTGGE